MTIPHSRRKLRSTNDSIEAGLEALGPALPATEGERCHGAAYGTMKPFHITGSALQLSRHVPVRNGAPLHPGRLGETVSIEQGMEAAQRTAMNALAGMKQALGDPERVVSLIESLSLRTARRGSAVRAAPRAS